MANKSDSGGSTPEDVEEKHAILLSTGARIQKGQRRYLREESKFCPQFDIILLWHSCKLTL